MTDVRALLKAKRQDARVTHPLASYTVNGQLRCVVCSTVVKHASAWQGHLGSKAHRTNVVRLKDEERKREADMEEGRLRGKRQADFEAMHLDRGDIKKPRIDCDVEANPSSYPVDFFSDPSRTLLHSSEDETDPRDGPSVADRVESTFDLEWEKFEKALLGGPGNPETYGHATVMAEPVLASETPEGFPPPETEDPQSKAPTKVDEEARQKKQQDERELILDRLLDEEAAQEEADMKVIVMKGRLEALKKKREASKVQRAKIQKISE